MSPRHYKSKLLLDENMPLREKLPRTNSRFDIKHLVTDYHKGGIKDEAVYKLACREKRIVVTFNESDFRLMARNNKKSGVIAISSHLSNEDIDKKLLSFLNKKGITYYGKFHRITGES